MKLLPFTTRTLAAFLAVAIAMTLAGSAPVWGELQAPVTPTLDLPALSTTLSLSLVDTITFVSPPGRELLGTGIIISATGEVLTCLHVVDGSNVAYLRVGGKGVTYTAKLVRTVPRDDLALLQIQGGGRFHPADLDLQSNSVGERVMALGNAKGEGGAPLASAGIVTSISARYSVADGMITSALKISNTIFQGDSGGVVVTSKGRVTGMIQEGYPAPNCTAVPTCQMNGGLAIPIRSALTALAVRPK